MSLEEVNEKLKELLNFDVTYFQNDKQNKIKKMTKEIEADLKKIENLKESELFCIKGLMYSVGDNYKKESEQYLTKSLKLDPTNVQAWNGLGESQIKKKDLPKAEFYFLYALKKRRNPDSLCKLSSINRLNGKESLSYSKEAISLDVTNADSWCKKT
jgi:tetratricopeptide (TPR) repeat protein